MPANSIGQFNNLEVLETFHTFCIIVYQHPEQIPVSLQTKSYQCWKNVSQIHLFVQNESQYYNSYYTIHTVIIWSKCGGWNIASSYAVVNNHNCQCYNIRANAVFTWRFIGIQVHTAKTFYRSMTLSLSVSTSVSISLSVTVEFSETLHNNIQQKLTRTQAVCCQPPWKTAKM